MEQLLGMQPGALQPEFSRPVSEAGPDREMPAEIPQPRAVGDEATPAPGFETPDRVMLEFNRWLEPYIQAGGHLWAVDVVEWMQRMWRASLGPPWDRRKASAIEVADSDIPLDIDVEPGTGIAITTSKGRLVVVNRALEAMLGLRSDELVGRYVWELNAPEYTKRGKGRIKEQLTEPWDLELMTGSGDRLPVTVSNVSCHLRGNPVRVALVKRRQNKPTG